MLIKENISDRKTRKQKEWWGENWIKYVIWCNMGMCVRKVVVLYLKNLHISEIGRDRDR